MRQTYGGFSYDAPAKEQLRDCLLQLVFSGPGTGGFGTRPYAMNRMQSVPTGRGRPVCRPAVRPTTGAHTGAPLHIPIGSGRKPDSPLSHGCAVPAPPEGEPLRAGGTPPLRDKPDAVRDGHRAHPCHCEERSDVAIRIPFRCVTQYRKRRTDSHGGAVPCLGMTEKQGHS